MKMLPFLLPFLFPITMIVGCAADELWLFRALPWACLMVSVLDLIVPANMCQSLTEPILNKRRAFFWQLIVRLWVPMQLMVIACGFIIMLRDSTFMKDLILVTATIGVASGMFCIPAAHELMHSKFRLDRVFAQILMMSVSYPHFCIEHIHGHHCQVGTVNDSATARFGESFYAFYSRAVFGGMASAWEIEKMRISRLGKDIWSFQNRIIQYVIFLSAIYASIYHIFGWHGIGFFAVQSIIAFSILEVVNYIQHYGLTRLEKVSGQYEQVASQHSWESDHRISNWMLLNLGYHADHHCHSIKHAHCLQHAKDAPQLPTGYVGLFFMPLFPALWRHVMDPRVKLWRKKTRVPLYDPAPCKTLLTGVAHENLSLLHEGRFAR